jgi:hypothetical protein
MSLNALKIETRRKIFLNYIATDYNAIEKYSNLFLTIKQYSNQTSFNKISQGRIHSRHNNSKLARKNYT